MSMRTLPGTGGAVIVQSVECSSGRRTPSRDLETLGLVAGVALGPRAGKVN